MMCEICVTFLIIKSMKDWPLQKVKYITRGESTQTTLTILWDVEETPQDFLDQNLYVVVDTSIWSRQVNLLFYIYDISSHICMCHHQNIAP